MLVALSAPGFGAEMPDLYAYHTHILYTIMHVAEFRIARRHF